MKSPQIPKLRDIAERVGVSRMAVSLALSGAPGVSQETRAKIRAVASELDYHRDPAVSRAVEFIRRSSARESPKIVALITHGEEDNWNNHPTLREYADGIRQRAALLGFDVQAFERFKNKMSDRRLSNILEARGIESLIIAPVPDNLLGQPIELDWTKFVGILLGQSVRHPRLHRVTPNYFQASIVCCREAFRRGYTRIALAISDCQDQRSEGRWHAGYLNAQAEKGQMPLPILGGRTGDREAFLSWVEQVRPDVILGLDAGIVDWLRQANYGVPDDVAIGLLSIRADQISSDMAGIIQGNFVIGEEAISMIAGTFIGTNPGRPPRVPKSLELSGRWREGWSLPWKRSKAEPETRPEKKAK